MHQGSDLSEFRAEVGCFWENLSQSLQADFLAFVAAKAYEQTARESLIQRFTIFLRHCFRRENEAHMVRPLYLVAPEKYLYFAFCQHVLILSCKWVAVSQGLEGAGYLGRFTHTPAHSRTRSH